MHISSWVILFIYLLLHLCAGMMLKWKPGFKPYFPELTEQACLELKRRLDKGGLKPQERVVRGAVAAAIMGLCALVIGGALQRIDYGVFNLVFLTVCVNYMTPLKLIKEVSYGVAGKEGHKPAIRTLQPYVKQSLAEADVSTVIRRTIEYMTASLNQQFVGPALWFALSGPLGMMFYVTFSSLNRAVGSSEAQRKSFGKWPWMIDMTLNFLPAAVTACIIVMSAPFIKEPNPLRAYKTILERAKKDYFPYSDWSVAAVAGALGITLSGSEEYGYKYHWIGPKGATAQLGSDALVRASILHYIFFIWTIILLIAAIIWKM